MSQNNTFMPAKIEFGRRQKLPHRPSMNNRHQPVLSANAARANAASTSASNPNSDRHIAWFDYAKGICIALVVMMHSTLGVEKLYGAEGFMHYIVSFAVPFRMPDFFFLSALFLPFAMPRKWPQYLDKKFLHFAYFYFLWLIILVVFKAAGKGDLNIPALGTHFFDAIIGPYPNLWFIYVLPLFFIVTKLLHEISGWTLFAFAALLQIASIQTGWRAIDDFAVHYYVYFVAGYLLSPYVFQLAENVRENRGQAIWVILIWAVVNGYFAFTPSPFAPWPTLASLPIVSIALGLAGAMSIILIASLLAIYDVGRFIRFCGQNSIVLYLSFTIPMAITRLVLAKINLIQDVGLVSLIVWLVALTSPLLVFMVLRRTPLVFLYQRPDAFTLNPLAKPAQKNQPTQPASRRPAQASVIRKPSSAVTMGEVGVSLLKPRIEA